MWKSVLLLVYLCLAISNDKDMSAVRHITLVQRQFISNKATRNYIVSGLTPFDRSHGDTGMTRKNIPQTFIEVNLTS